MLIKACLNGSREPGVHPALPLSPTELARAGALAVAAGAGALHIHPRDAGGGQTLAADDQAAALAAIRASCPGIPVGVSTGIWIEPDVARRLQRVRDWTLLPDFASVNFDEPGVGELCEVLFQRGIGVEAGLSTVEDVERLSALGFAERCLRILIEVGEEDTTEALATATAIIRALDDAHIQSPRLLHGFDATAWAVLSAAIGHSYDTRIGLEDTLTMPDGSQARDNASLVALAANIAGIM